MCRHIEPVKDMVENFGRRKIVGSTLNPVYITLYLISTPIIWKIVTIWNSERAAFFTSLFLIFFPLGLQFS